jgi:hypothetical protein
MYQLDGNGLLNNSRSELLRMVEQHKTKLTQLRTRTSDESVVLRNSDYSSYGREGAGSEQVEVVDASECLGAYRWNQQ